MMLLPLAVVTVRFCEIVPAAASLVGVEECGRRRLGPSASAACTARSQLVMMATSAPMMVSIDLLEAVEEVLPSIESMALRSRT